MKPGEQPESRPRNRSRHSIEEEAGDWVARLDRGLSPDEAVQLAAWESADPKHGEALSRLNQLWQSLDTADENPEVMEIAHAVEERHVRRIHFRQIRPWILSGMAAAAIALVWIGQSYQPKLESPTPSAVRSLSRSYRVIPSAAQRLQLADGTVVELNANSAVEPSFTASERSVRLVRGEAHFFVVKDPVRPFVVHAGKIVVRAVGTAFNVRLEASSIEVLVTEGKVRVEDAVHGTSLLPDSGESTAAPGPTTTGAPVLAAGQRLQVTPDARQGAVVSEVTADDIERALAWQRTSLVFERTSLEDAVAAFNSFNRTQLVIGDSELRARKLGGNFRAENLDAFVRMLETGFDITAERPAASTILLRARK